MAPIVDSPSTPSKKDIVLHKTGLGSSACLCTSLTSSLSHYFSPTVTTHTLHKLSQSTHCKAQGKVGSGFDVATAVYGSCVYERFSKGNIERLEVRESVDREWDHKVTPKSPSTILPGTTLMLGDVSGGSESEGMARKVLKWVKESDGELWSRLIAEVDSGLRVFEDGDKAGLTASVSVVRSKIKEIGVLSGVGVEPDEQTDLCDMTSGIGGVVACGVPGAGGVDAIYAIVEDEAVKEVEEAWEKWEATKVRRIKVEFDEEGGLVVTAEQGGEKRLVKGRGRREQIRGWSVKEMKAFAVGVCGISLDGCVEKRDIYDRIVDSGMC